MGKSLMDSNTVIYFLSGSLPNSANITIENKIQSNHIAISDVSKMEILGFNFSDPEEEQAFINFVNAIDVINLSPYLSANYPLSIKYSVTFNVPRTFNTEGVSHCFNPIFSPS